MQTSHIYRPTLNSGSVYARLAGSAAPMQSIGGVASLEISVEEDVKKQADYERGGGGTRAQINRVTACTMKGTLQDLNPVNLARVLFGETTAVPSAAIANEAHTAYKGGLLALAHINPTSVTVKTTGGSPTAITMSGNYEVRPEGIFVLDDAPDITNGQAITVDYTHGMYDAIQALTTTAPTLEIRFSGINEAGSGSASVVDLFLVKMGATKSLGLINDDFATLDVEGEVLKDTTKTGIGISQYFRQQMATPA